MTTESQLAPKSLLNHLEPAPLNIKNLYTKVKESKDSAQLETVLLRFYTINSTESHIKALYSLLHFDESNRKFQSALTKEEVITIMESEYDFNQSSLPQSQCLSQSQSQYQMQHGGLGFGGVYSLSSTFEPKVEDIFAGIIKKPIALIQTQNTQDNLSEYDPFPNQFLTNSIKDWPEDLGNSNSNNKDNNPNSIWKTNSMLNSFAMNTNTNYNNNNNQLSANSSFQKMDDSYYQLPMLQHSQYSNVSQVKRFLKKKRLGVPIVLSNTNNASISPKSSQSHTHSQKPLTPMPIKRNTFIAIKPPLGIGLKEISNYVNVIIQRAAQTSYKEISDEIINIIQAKNDKEEKNIRRRIYDSLNVMKSLRIFFIDKMTKKIVLFSNDNDDDTNAYDKGFAMDDKAKEQFELITKELRFKQYRLGVLNRQLEALKSLVSRNKEFDSFIDNKQKIYLPFFVVEFLNKGGDEGKVYIDFNENKTQAHISSNSTSSLYGDVEAVFRIMNANA